MFKKILSTFGTKFITAILAFVVTILTTRYLGAEGRGIIGLLNATIGIFIMVSGFIGGSNLVYLVPRKKLFPLIIPSYIWVLIVSITGLFILKLTSIVPYNIVIHVFFLALISCLWRIHSHLLIGKGLINTNNFILLAFSIINFILVFSLFSLFGKASVSTYIFVLYVSAIGIFFVNFLFIKKHILFSSFTEIKETLPQIIKYGFMAQLASVIQFLNYRLGYYILHLYLGTYHVGLYSVGVQISESVWMISRSIALVQFSAIANSEDIEYSRNLTLKLAKFSFVSTLLVIIPPLLLPSSFFTFVFGPDFAPLKIIFIALSPGIICFSYVVLLSHYFAGIGKFYINVLGSLVGFVFTIVFNILLVPKYGYIGAAIAATLSFAASSIFLILIFLRETGYNFRKLLPGKEDVAFVYDKLIEFIQRKK